MSALSKILRDAEGDRLLFWCPGCECAHGPIVGAGSGPRWTWNGDVDRPTFTPSILVRSGDRNGPTVCHSFVTDGQIRFLDDCTHALKGQTVALPDFD